MMYYRTIKTAIQTILAESSLSNYRVVGFQRQSKSADETLNNDRLVQVYYSEGDFPKSAGRNKGSKSHDLTIEIDMTVSAKAQADMSILDSTTATAEQKANAIAGLKEAAEIADEKLDELIDRVWNIMLDTRNYDLGLEVGAVSSPWIAKITKDTLLERGDLVVKTANMKYTCRVQEYVLGTTGTQPDPAIISSTIPIGDGEIGGSGVEVENAVPS
jgi:hypothetical protein